MAQIVRYRTGIDGETGKPLRGRAHLRQSIADIWLTRTNSVPMLLDYGSSARSFLAEDITPSLALAIYDELVTVVHRWEPEARISDLQLVYLSREGRLGLEYGGTYYPEGRLGNYAIAEPLSELQRFAQRARQEGRAA